MATKKRQPQDLTSRNNNARKKEIATLKARVKRLEDRVRMLESRIKGELKRLRGQINPNKPN